MPLTLGQPEIGPVMGPILCIFWMLITFLLPAPQTSLDHQWKANRLTFQEQVEFLGQSNILNAILNGYVTYSSARYVINELCKNGTHLGPISCSTVARTCSDERTTKIFKFRVFLNKFSLNINFIEKLSSSDVRLFTDFTQNHQIFWMRP